jgi:hypothetical protein
MSIPDGLYNVKFAEYLESIKILYLIDDRFKIICNDYCTSKLNTQSYMRKFEKKFRQHLKFENLSKELEEEILIYIIKNS